MTSTLKLLSHQGNLLLWLLMLCALWGCENTPPASGGGSSGAPNQPSYGPDGLLTHFNTPAYVGYGDVEGLPGESQQAFFDAWSDYVSAWTDNSATVGLEPGNTNSLPNGYYYNPMREAMSQPPIVVPARWNAFPYRIRFYYQAQLDSMFPGKINVNGTEYPQAPYELFKLADMGPDAYGAVTSGFKQDVLPGDLLCSGENKKFGTAPFDPDGPRGWLDEYCEFGVSRKADGDIDWAMFTCENPEYYWTLWSVSPESVRDIYRETLGNNSITVEDLCLKDANGKCVEIPGGGIAYNPINPWNKGTVINPGVSGGAIHLTSPPNELSAEIILAGGACIPRQNGGGWNTAVANDLICCSQYGRPYRNSDPHIGQSVYQAISKNPIAGTLLDPVGLYLQMPNFDLYEIPQKVKDMGGKIEDCWQVLRGEVSNPYYPNNMILRTKFEVPDSWGIQTSDIKVAGLPLLYASQISQSMQVQLAAGSKTMSSIAPSQPCVEAKPEAKELLLASYTKLFDASVAAGLDTACNFSSNPITTQLGVPKDSVVLIVSSFDRCSVDGSLGFKFFDTATGDLTQMSFDVGVVVAREFEDTPSLLIIGTVNTPQGTPYGNKSVQISCDIGETMITPGYFRVAQTY